MLGGAKPKLKPSRSSPVSNSENDTHDHKRRDQDLHPERVSAGRMFGWTMWQDYFIRSNEGMKRGEATVAFCGGRDMKA